MIAIPCNTAHAFIDQVPASDSAPIVNMIEEAAADTHRKFPEIKRVGILATTGTMKSRIYHTALASFGLQLIDPDVSIQQELVMPAIGRIKAGLHDEVTADLLEQAAQHLVSRGAEVLLAGCTEIVLGLPVNRTTVPLEDPAQSLVEELLRRAQ